MTQQITSIRVSTALREKLRKLGHKGETYHEIVDGLIREHEERSPGNEGG